MKIVYNSCYGGFSLSRKGVLLGRKLSSDPTWGGVCIKGDAYEDGTACDSDYGHCGNIERHDPILVAVVEKLGHDASGSCAHLEIAEVEKGQRYRIDEYDGSESVQTVDSYDWKVAE